MRAANHIFVWCLTILSIAGSVCGWEYEEHRSLGDSVFAEIQRTYNVQVNMPDSINFGELCARNAADDMEGDRYHERGKTVLDQLKPPIPGPDGYLECLLCPTRTIAAGDNLISKFLAYHVWAMQRAKLHVDTYHDTTALPEIALKLEAIAQGYLADAFAAGHILSYNDLPGSWLHRRNRIEAHDYHRDRGVYVINGEGEIWQTFGDGLLNWYPPTKRAVMEACRRSWHELLLVWYQSSGQEIPDSLTAWLNRTVPGRVPRRVVSDWLSEANGQNFYTKLRLPSLMMIPMPVAATWSFRTDRVGEHGDRLQIHYPQLLEDGLHDPDLIDIDTSFLYSRESVPSWMIPEPLRNGTQTAQKLIDDEPNYASVRWMQERYAPPSYKGLLVTFGGQLTIGRTDTRFGGTMGLGYGIWDDLLLIKNVSAGLTLMPSLYEPNHRLLLISGGGAFDLPGDSWLQAVRLEGGLGIGLGKEFNDVGSMFAIGVDSKVIPFRFTYAGLTLRFKYQWLHLDNSLSGPSLELVFQ